MAARFTSSSFFARLRLLASCATAAACGARSGAIGDFDGVAGAATIPPHRAPSAPPAPSRPRCTIAGVEYAPGAPNPVDSCERCVPERATNTWSLAARDRCVTAVSVGQGHACALVARAVLDAADPTAVVTRAYCWGANGNGQLGNGTRRNTRTPAEVQGLGADVRAIVAHGNATCALVDGAVSCWGNAVTGELERRSEGDRLLPELVQGLPPNVIAIALADASACASTREGIFCWGYNESGELGNGRTQPSRTPVRVRDLRSGATAIAADWHACAIVEGGAKCWGSNGTGQIGDGSTMHALAPKDVVGLGSGVTSVSVGEAHSCAVAGARASCWGRNDDGQLGNELAVGSPVPIPVQGLSKDVSVISTGGWHTCTIAGEDVACWGSNTFGQLGNPRAGARSAAPVSVSGLGARAHMISAGYYNTCAVLGTRLRCWGYNESGQLGDGSTTSSPVPVDVSFPWDSGG